MKKFIQALLIVFWMTFFLTCFLSVLVVVIAAFMRISQLDPDFFPQIALLLILGFAVLLSAWAFKENG